MKQLLIEVDEETAKRLEQFAPARSRRRSEFIRMAIRKALWEIEEQKTACAYAEKSDSIEAAYFEPRVWESPPKKRAKRSGRR